MRTDTILGFFGILVSLYLISLGIQDNRLDTNFRINGVAATVDPIHGYTERTSRKKGTSYSADLSFKTTDGRQVTVNKTISSGMLQAFTDGKAVQIVYLSNDPTTVRFPGYQSDSGMIWIGIFALLGSCFYMWYHNPDRKISQFKPRKRRTRA
jgi:hypothetical protein